MKGSEAQVFIGFSISYGGDEVSLNTLSSLFIYTVAKQLDGWMEFWWSHHSSQARVTKMHKSRTFEGNAGSRVPEVARSRREPSLKSLDWDKKLKPWLTVFCRDIKICRELRGYWKKCSYYMVYIILNQICKFAIMKQRICRENCMTWFFYHLGLSRLPWAQGNCGHLGLLWTTFSRLPYSTYLCLDFHLLHDKAKRTQ